MAYSPNELINRITGILKEEQNCDGSWDYPFDTGVKTDAYMIILLKTLEINDEDLIRRLTERILSKQEKNGAWKLYYDEKDGNLSYTVEAYYALLYSGFYPKSDTRLRLAKSFILKNGGMEKAGIFTKVLLALTGQYKWPAFFPLPVELILLPLSFPINFYDFSVFGRANLAPIMILAAKKYNRKTKDSPDLSDLFVNRTDEFFSADEKRSFENIFSIIEQGIKSILMAPGQLRSYAIERAKQYMLNHLEPDGTFYSYFSSTFLMIFALMSLGYKKDDPVILKAVEGLKGMECTIKGYTHMQYTTANVWNTALISYTLQNAGVPASDPTVIAANEYLLEKQHYKYGDWVIHNPSALPGGWGFSDINTFNPDVDDTTAALRAFSPLVTENSALRSSWDRGTNWTISMQNNDGGWPAFERNVDKKIMNLLPIEKARFLVSDASSADLTGRTLEFFGNYTNMPKKSKKIRNGAEWLKADQKKDGSWYGRWGICFIYGTWAAVTGLMAIGFDRKDKSIQNAAAWLKRIQNKDGGWGESCSSDIENTYVPLRKSHITQTAWALDALIAAENQPTPEIQAGVRYLLHSYDSENWTWDYPVGQGMGGGFYIHYHSYRYIFPLLALSNYEKKFIRKAQAPV
ncbi:squalene--hopene cyclase [Siminovitchia fortis]|uniref:squalene--hopene cyclase n=1 Tax=Siminovitchia fortis TaxID=254758 RepID=UPI0011AA4780|nr:squalene--hopene cyclase [Siminovitchia fortis]